MLTSKDRGAGWRRKARCGWRVRRGGKDSTMQTLSRYDEALAWTPARPPERAILAGATVRLEPVDPHSHAAALFAAGHDERDIHLWDYMSVGPFPDQDAFTAWLQTAAAPSDPLYFTVID